MLNAENVTYRYKNTSNDVLRGVSCSFDAGCMYGLVGRSGSGKTTLLSLLADFDTPTSGRILFEGENLSTRNVDEYRRREVGVVFQGYNLIYAMTAVENVMLALSLTSGIRSSAGLRRRALELLAWVGIDESTASKRSLHISGGEQQRVSIARALCKNPALLLCDEPTGALDSKTGEQVLELLTRVTREFGATVVIITHNASIAPLGDRVIRIRNGSVQSVERNEHPARVEDITW